MFRIMMGQNGDDYVTSERSTLPEAKTDAKDWLKKIKKQNLGTYVYILTPEGKRIDPSDFDK